MSSKALLAILLTVTLAGSTACAPQYRILAQGKDGSAYVVDRGEAIYKCVLQEQEPVCYRANFSK